MSRPVEVVSVVEPPVCPRCDGEGLLSALVAHGWTNARGAAVRGRVPVVLCARCDSGDPHAGPLITWFHVHGTVTGDVAEAFTRLLDQWTGHLRPPTLDGAALEADAWRHGEL
ncbi:DUF6300 family protein [Streptosporangium pseudovulgare]|uniref:Uncharacterized protein n=1 Tax=Streptosporangium pseudovulgare TaxID=35765 RepID=A0ABQ2R504_9ACTN|nr:DUF6300 family protein [Streptosporangium pseudovulgare]GGQ12712.1 hypothetical protein GCM10010140_48720 [Streptosporangium pseudovulgare]